MKKAKEQRDEIGFCDPVKYHQSGQENFFQHKIKVSFL